MISRESQLAEASAWLEELHAAPEPPREIRGGRPRKNGSGRWRKLHCESCGFIAQASAGAVQRCGLPTCACGAPMVLAHLRDRMRVDEAGATAEIESLPAQAQRDAWRSLGFTGMVERSRGLDRASGVVQHRCEAPSCTRYTSARYCAEHEAHTPALTSAYKGRGS